MALNKWLCLIFLGFVLIQAVTLVEAGGPGDAILAGGTGGNGGQDGNGGGGQGGNGGGGGGGGDIW